VSNWQDVCDYLAEYLDAGDDDAQRRSADLRMRMKTPGAIIDGFSDLSMVLLQRLAQAQGADGADEIRRKARETLRELRQNPPPGD
jgi:hypothetical protein